MKFVIACFLAAAALSGCAVTQRVAFKRCPTVYSSGADVIVTTVALALSVLAYSNHDMPRTVGYAAGGMGVALSANLAECRRTVIR